MPLRVYSFFLPFRPFYASMAAAPSSSSSSSPAAAQEVETSGANANETDLICAIICMTHIVEQGGTRGEKGAEEAAALGFGV